MSFPSPILKELRGDVESGTLPDYPRLFRLQALAVAEAGEQYAEDARLAQEYADEQWYELARD